MRTFHDWVSPPSAGLKDISNSPGPGAMKSVALYWSPNACLPTTMGLVHPVDCCCFNTFLVDYGVTFYARLKLFNFGLGATSTHTLETRRAIDNSSEAGGVLHKPQKKKILRTNNDAETDT